MRSSRVDNKDIRAAVEHLREYPKGTELPSANIAQAIGIGDAGNIGSRLMSGVRAGLLRRRMEGGFVLWSLGDNPTFIDPASSKVADVATVDVATQQVRRVSAMAAPSIFAYADERAAAPFSCALSTDGRLTVERYGRVLLELTGVERKLLLDAARSVEGLA